MQAGSTETSTLVQVQMKLVAGTATISTWAGDTTAFEAQFLQDVSTALSIPLARLTVESLSFPDQATALVVFDIVPDTGE